MKRRHLLKYGTLAACGYGLTACDRLSNLMRPPEKTVSIDEIAVTEVARNAFGNPEKQTIALGYEPNISVAPWMVAIEQGFFAQYGLEVKLYKQANAEEVERGILEARFDGAITSFVTPLINQLKTPKIDLVALMQIHRHGSVLTLDQAVWDKNIRSGIDYATFEEFSGGYRDYVRALPKKSFGVDDLYSTTAYLYRYWWAAMGFHPERDLELLAFAPTELHHKLEAGLVQGYCCPEPWGQAAIATKAGFVGYLSGEIWRGHPGAVITSSAGWVKENPNTAKALMAASLMGCQFCQNSANAATVANLLSEPLAIAAPSIETLLNGQYFYGGDSASQSGSLQDRPISRKDNPIWFDTGTRLTAPDNANYCWQSHGIWLLTQIVRWQHFGLKQYPQNAQDLVAAAYPKEPYGAVAKAFGLTLPPQSTKPETQFIDQRHFNPDQAQSYLNQFKMRA